MIYNDILINVSELVHLNTNKVIYMKYNKEKIEQIYNVKVIAAIGTTKFLTVKKEESLRIETDGHRIIDTSIFYGEVDIINENPFYNCTDCETYWYDIDDNKITKLC